MRALIDGDIIIFRAGFASERSVYKIYPVGEEDYIASFTNAKARNEWLKEWGEDNFYYTEDREVDAQYIAVSNMNNVIQYILRKLQITEYTIYLSGEHNFRYETATILPYKGNRKDMRRPYHEYALYNYLKDRHNSVVVENIEADDALGIEASSDPNNCIICTLDKDLDMIPGWHYNWVSNKLYHLDEINALRNFYLQLLTGDPTDNILGVPGCGPKTADKVLDKVDNRLPVEEQEKRWYQQVLHFYKENLHRFSEYTRKKPEDIIREFGKLLWIQRYPGDIWEPPEV